MKVQRRVKNAIASPAPGAVLVGALCVGLFGCSSSQTPPSSRPAPAVVTADCTGCHQTEAEAWRGSGHQRAAVRPTFARSLAKSEQGTWCLTCHAPLSGRADDARGVGCRTCHIVPGDWSTQDAAHPTLGPVGTERCAACHQFRMPRSPTGPVVPSEVWAQATHDEWAQSGSEKSCADCHQGPHAVKGSAPETVRAALELTVVQDSPTSVTVLARTTRAVGHAVPTGDPFVRLVFELCDDPRCEFVRSGVSWGRTVRPGNAGPEDSADTRPRPGAPAEHTFAVEAPGPTHWRLQRVAAESGLPTRRTTVLHGAVTSPPG